ncbi:unnamed protein product [Cyclocybe aegerita]|uniref:Uncharacterized protein n=1 Tax=Cyclocybe aegerita TaxID=1973307 RepID=A0A8S0W492_CYCAE|nr:unnamed protein product [Cyclocybe aegerita]
MRTFSYIIVPALALLNMGVHGATIANVLTARHPTQLQGVSAFGRGLALNLRQVHNADFSSSTAPTAAPASDPAPAVEPAATAAKRDGDVTSDANIDTNTLETAAEKPVPNGVGGVVPSVQQKLPTREVHARQDDPAADTTADTDSVDADQDDTVSEADPDIEDADAAVDTADTTAVTRAVHARQDEDDAVDPAVDTDSTEADDDDTAEDAAEDAADTADTATVTRAVHARQDEDIDPAVDTDSDDTDEDDAAAEEDAAAAEPTETPDNVSTAQDLTTQAPDEESFDARADTHTLIKPLALPRDLIANRRQVGQSLSGDKNNIVSDVQIKAPLSDVPGPSLAGRRSIMKQVGRRAPQFQGAVAGSGAGAVSLRNSGSS